MADLYSSIGQNAQKVTHDTFNYGTPRIYPLVIIRIDEGDWTGYASTGSDFYKVVNYLQGRGVEIYGIGEVSGTVFTILTNWGKVPKDSNNSEEPNDDDDIDLFATEISTLLSIGVDVYYGKIQGSSISYNC
jgi:hypothetical protein